MTILGLCFDATTPGVPHGHDLRLVVLSFIVAALASYASLDTAERLRAAEGRVRGFWLAMGGLTLGGGVWAMHFIGMVAFEAPLEQGYSLRPTILSGVVVVMAAIGGLALLGRAPDWKRLAAGGAVVGIGVVAMHYVGMTALKVPGEIVYRPGLFSLAVLIALTAATVALWLATSVSRLWHRVLAAIVMAIAVCGMHYTAMEGTVLIEAPMAETGGAVISKGLLAAVVAIGLFGLIALGMITAYLDRRMESRGEMEARRLRALNHQLDQARIAAEDAARAKALFLATMSHEIRTPMNGVLGMLEAALRTDLSPNLRDQLNTAHDSAADLLKILNGILDFSKLEAGKVTLEALSFSPRQMVDDVMSMHAAQASARGLELRLDVDPETPEWIVGDPTRVRQVLVNLVSNALKFTEQGEVSVRLSWSSGAQGEAIRIEVRDTGVGIDEAARAGLFRHFTQADASTTRRFGGAGLGLAICRELVERMGGRIDVESAPGEGSMFWFNVPTRIGEEPDHAGAGLVTASQPARRLAILVAEDNPVNQKVLKALLSPHGHELIFANNGAEAVEVLGKRAFDVVLMDISMPVMDGPAAARAIRGLNGAVAETPIIALTANAMAGDRETYLAGGMDDYVSKPVDINALLAAIARWTGGGEEAAAGPPPRLWRAEPEPGEDESGDAADDILALIDAELAPRSDVAA